MKTILLPIHDDNGAEARLQTALDLARAHDAHINCLQVTPFNTYVAMDSLGGAFVLPDLIDAVNKQVEKFRTDTQARLAREDVPWSYEHLDGDPAHVIVDRSGLADLIILSPALREAGPREPLSVAGDVAVHGRTPVLVVPPSSKGFDARAKAFVAWNRSPEAANALKAALPALRLSSSVLIATIAEVDGDTLPPIDACTYLSRHGIAAEMVALEGPGEAIAETLLHARARCGAGYVVMGAYGHTRLREFILGGTTRQMLRDCPVPIFMAH